MVTKAMFFLTLPILIICLAAWLIDGLWIFPLIYAFAWFMALCLKEAFKIMGLDL